MPGLDQHDFSIGLIFQNSEGKSFVLFRCNGPHGECTDDFLEGETHFGFHEHHLLPESCSGMVAKLTKAYGTYQDAIRHFVERCNIVDAVVYFSFLKDQEGLQFELGI